MKVKLPGVTLSISSEKPQKPFTPDLSSFDFTVDDIWNILGLMTSRVQEINMELDNILKLHQNMTFKDLLQKALREIPKTQAEFNYLLFHFGQRWQIIQQPQVFVHHQDHPHEQKPAAQEKLVN